LLSNVYNQNAYFSDNGVRTTWVAAVLKTFPIQRTYETQDEALGEISDNERRDSKEENMPVLLRYFLLHLEIKTSRLRLHEIYIVTCRGARVTYKMGFWIG
jgi:hypothetical protein